MTCCERMKISFLRTLPDKYIEKGVSENFKPIGVAVSEKNFSPTSKVAFRKTNEFNFLGDDYTKLKKFLQIGSCLPTICQLKIIKEYFTYAKKKF